MRRPMFIAVVSILALINSGVFSSPVFAKKVLFGAHSVLLTLKTPQDLLLPEFPTRYRVPVTLGGAIADEISSTIHDLKLPSPQFEEIMAKRGSFQLSLSNDNYDNDTRELLTGILNPLEIIDITVNAILRYRDKQYFPTIVNETNITVSHVSINSRRCIDIDLTPKGDRFGYLYDDNGVYVQESWLAGISIVADSASHLVYELTQHKIGRRFTLASSEKPVPDTSVCRYRFEYEHTGETAFPKSLSLELNGVSVLKITAAYRTEGSRTVFDSRSVCCTQDNREQCLEMRYGVYSFDNVPRNEQHLSATVTSRELAAAAKLAREATYQLRAGMIFASKRTLGRLIEEYPTTPQAIEAKRLLANLPNAF